jgi:hypothetical protein
MRVSNIVVTRETGRGNRTNGVAAVTIVDAGDNPVSGAMVTGDFTGPSSGTESGTTDGSGYDGPPARLRPRNARHEKSWNPPGDP